jgi:hypothetical protein
MWIAEVCPTAAPKRPQREASKLPSKQFGVACTGLETERSKDKVLLDEARDRRSLQKVRSCPQAVSEDGLREQGHPP